MTDWSCRILCAPAQQEIIHLCWEIEWSHWFHFNKRRSHLSGENEYSLLPGALTYFPPRLIQCAPMRGSLWKTLLLNEPPENISPANTSTALSRFCPHMTDCICQYVQWTQSQFHYFYNDILIDWCYLLARFHSSFSFISIDFSTPLADSLSSHGVKGQRGKHYVLSVWMMQLFMADKKELQMSRVIKVKCK